MRASYFEFFVILLPIFSNQLFLKSVKNTLAFLFSLSMTSWIYFPFSHPLFITTKNLSILLFLAREFAYRILNLTNAGFTLCLVTKSPHVGIELWTSIAILSLTKKSKGSEEFFVLILTPLLFKQFTNSFSSFISNLK